jgi:HPt (histidine-containing phosphotransfer) domain-containing protein
VALTANAVAGQAGIFLGNGFDEFISKPIDLRQLNMILNRMIRDKQSPEVLEAARLEAEAKKEQVSPMQQTEDQEFIKLFIRDAKKSLETLGELYDKTGFYEDSGDLRTFTIHMHAIKSALANVGKMDLSAAALKLKQAAQDGVTEIVAAETPEFLIALKAYLEELTLQNAATAGKARASALSKEIAGLDIDSGLEQMGGDEAAYIKIMRSYAANVRSMLLTIEAVEEETLADYKITVHGIKGTSYYIFAQQVGRLAEALEKASAAGDFAFASEHNPEFLETAWKLVKDIEEMLLAYDAENPKPTKQKPDAEALAKVLDACQRFDMDDLDTAMDEIEQYQYVNDDGLVEWLRETVDLMDMTQIIDRLSNLGEPGGGQQ